MSLSRVPVEWSQKARSRKWRSSRAACVPGSVSGSSVPAASPRTTPASAAQLARRSLRIVSHAAASFCSAASASINRASIPVANRTGSFREV